MKVTVATRHFFSSIQGLFSKVSDDIGTISPQEFQEIRDSKGVFSTDLLIFAGGEDINPEFYGSKYKTFFSEERDTWEMNLLDAVTDGRIEAKKVFGICRGLQMLNVYHGGTLVTDIPDFYGMEHSYVHPIVDVVSDKGLPNPFAEITMVNSMHHQGIHRAGTDMRVLSVEPRTKLPEIVTWGSKFLGMQFHPEFFDDSNQFKWKIADTIAEWVGGKEFFPGLDRTVKKKLSIKESIEQARRELEAFRATANQQEPSVTISVQANASGRWSTTAGTGFEFQTIEENLEEDSMEDSEE